MNGGPAKLRPLAEYRLLIFDCDGVVLDSNAVKTEAFRTVAAPFGTDIAARFVHFHQQNGGLSRYVKLRQLLREAGIDDDARLPALLDAFAAEVRDGLRQCPVTPRLDALRRATRGARWAIASGADQTELREVLGARGLDDLFDAGIHGSPTPKTTLVQQLVADHGGAPPAALMLGDSRLDHEAATASGIDFVFVSAWTEYDEWAQYVARHALPTIVRADALLPTVDRP